MIQALWTAFCRWWIAVLGIHRCVVCQKRADCKAFGFWVCEHHERSLRTG